MHYFKNKDIANFILNRCHIKRVVINYNMIANLALLALLGTASAMSPVFVSTDDLQQMLTLKSDRT
jgi:hypothetical protein